MSDTLVTCWKDIGVWGDQTCSKLSEYIHCRNCPLFAEAGRKLLDRAPPPGYLTEWAADLARVKEHQALGDHCIFTFRLGSEYFGLPVQDIVEIMEPLPVRKIPHRKSPVLKGLISIRGQLQLCISLHALLGIDHPGEEQSDDAGRICIIEHEGETWVFALDACIGIQRYVEDDIHPLPTTLDKATIKYTESILQMNDGQSMGLLNTSTIINDINKSIRK